MTWETRVKVAAGAARGIAYLHEDCKLLLHLYDFVASFLMLCLCRSSSDYSP